jgi:CRP-like cAMP-binding protein
MPCSEDRAGLLAYVFPSVKRAAIQELCGFCFEVQHGPDELIAQEGSYASGIYIVQQGLVKIGKYASHGGEKRVLRFLGVGELFGLESVILEHSTNVQYAKTLMKTTLVFIERSNLLRFRKRYPEMCSDFCRWLAREVVMLEFKLTREAVESLDRNLALLLIALAHNYGCRSDRGVSLEPPVSRKTMAEMLGVSVETLMRALKRFRERSMIETEGRIILLTNFDALKERARTTPFYLSIIEETL